MSDYKEILTSDRVYKKYKSIIPDTNVSFGLRAEGEYTHYKKIRFSKDTSEKGKEILEYYNGVGSVYSIEPPIPQDLMKVTNVPVTLMYVNPATNQFILSGQSEKFTEKITAEIVLLRGLTKAEHNSKELVFHYVDTINNYYN